MIEEDTDLPLVDQMQQPIDMGKILSLIIAITRRDWLPQEYASLPADQMIVIGDCSESP